MPVRDKYTCPSGHDLRAGEIPRESLKAGFYGEWKEGDPPKFYSRKIGVEVTSIYDGVAYWECPVDGEVWHRFPVGDPRRERVEAYWRRNGKGGES